MQRPGRVAGDRPRAAAEASRLLELAVAKVRLGFLNLMQLR
jgi:hypothetical protein